MNADYLQRIQKLKGFLENKNKRKFMAGLTAANQREVCNCHLNGKDFVYCIKDERLCLAYETC